MIRIALAAAVGGRYVACQTQMQLPGQVMSWSGRPPGFEENAAFEDEPALAPRVALVLEDAQKAGHLSRQRAALTLDVDQELLEALKRRTGLDDPAAVIEFALAHVALDSDFVVAARRTWQAIDDDLDFGDLFADV
ncbi:hypothetical protein [Salinarimonas sp.]|uniref:hypothetical protein n=1 Tax=Salinarimonas sp. TaxID=2766526 RepID=UPI0032D92602